MHILSELFRPLTCGYAVRRSVTCGFADAARCIFIHCIFMHAAGLVLLVSGCRAASCTARTPAADCRDDDRRRATPAGCDPRCRRYPCSRAVEADTDRWAEAVAGSRDGRRSPAGGGDGTPGTAVRRG